MKARGELGPHGAAVTGLLLCAVAAGVRAQVQESLGRARSAASPTILSVKVKSFNVRRATMEEALLALRSQDVNGIVIGFEELPHPASQRTGGISISIQDGTVGEIVRRLCAADPRYEYQVVQNSMIDVRPEGALSDPRDLLNIRLSRYSIEAKQAGATEAIEHIAQDAPELRGFLQRKHEEWAAKTGRVPGGYPGSIISGNMPPPPFILDLHDVTVRQVLDAISLKSIRDFKEGKVFESAKFPTKVGPVGWKYHLILDPGAATGLGGYPTWQPF